MARALLAFVALIIGSLNLCGSAMAQAKDDNQKAKDAMQPAAQIKRIGEILATAGITLMVLSIPIGIFWDRRKNARKRASMQSEARERRRGEGDS